MVPSATGETIIPVRPRGTYGAPPLTAAGQAAEAGVRVVTMRAGVVVSRHGGILARLLPPFRLGLGARLGSGTQAMSWITLADYAAIVSFLLAHPEISGPVNLTTPHPVTNAEFTSALAAALHRPALFFVPEPAQIGCKYLPEVHISSQQYCCLLTNRFKATKCRTGR